MSATAEKCGKLSHATHSIDDPKFNITSVELDTMLWFQTILIHIGAIQAVPNIPQREKAYFMCYKDLLLKYKRIKKLQKLIGGDCGKKATLTKNQVTCSGCSVTDAGNGTFTIEPNGNGAVNVTWSGSVEAS